MSCCLVEQQEVLNSAVSNVTHEGTLNKFVFSNHHDCVMILVKSLYSRDLYSVTFTTDAVPVFSPCSAVK